MCECVYTVAHEVRMIYIYLFSLNDVNVISSSWNGL